MKKILIISFIIVICFVALFWITIETNTELATKLGYASGPGKPVEVIPDTPNAMVPSIVYGGKLYRTTGKQIPAEVDESATYPNSLLFLIALMIAYQILPCNQNKPTIATINSPADSIILFVLL